MSDQDVFETTENPDQGTQTTEPQAQPQPVDVFADKLNTILNEDGTPKYPDVASALDSIPHAQQHIQKLEREAAELRDKLAREQAAKDLLAKQTEKAPQSQLTEEQAARIAMEAQQKAMQRQTEEANVATVNSTFSQVYGSKASEEMQKLATESGMSIDKIKDLAKTSPQAVFRMAGIQPKTTTPVPPKAPGAGSHDQFTERPAPTPPKSVMGGGSTADVMASWNAAKETVLGRMQQE